MTPALQPTRHEFLLPIPSRVRRALRRRGRLEGATPAELARRAFGGEDASAAVELTDRTFRRLEAAASKLGFTAGDLIRIGLQRMLKEAEGTAETGGLTAAAQQSVPQPRTTT